MSIQSNFPAIKPSLLLDFANTKQLDPRITFTRASTATFYDGVTTAKAEENLLVQSQTFETTWAPLNTSITANTSVAPDGTTTADTLADNTTTGTHVFNQSPAFIAGAVYTMSVFMKAGTNNFGVLTLTNATTAESGISAVVDLSAGTISETDTGTSATFTSSSITSVGSGWYRVVITGSSVAGFNRAEIALAPVGTGNIFTNTQRISYTGTGTTILIWGAQLEQRSAATAYTATTTQPITNYIPVLRTAAAGVARFDHNPVTEVSLGLEIEEQRTNLVTYSEQFDNAAWTKGRSSITANTIVAPDGTLTGDKLVEDTTASNTHTIIQSSLSFTSGTSYTLSVFAKAAERSVVRLTFPSAAFGAAVAYNFDLLSATTTLVTAGTGNSATITSVGNGWYRCTVTAQATATASSSVTLFLISGGTASYTGDGYSGIFIWGAQLEAGAFATSYIPTVASQVTRSADAASMTGTNFSSWYNQAEGTFFSSVVLNQAPALSGSASFYAASDNTTSNRIFVSRGTGSGGNINAVITSGGVLQAQTINGSLSTAGAYLYANAYKVNDFASAANGGVAITDTSGTVPVVDRLYLGSTAIGSPTLNSTIRKIAYYPLRLTNTNLQALTS